MKKILIWILGFWLGLTGTLWATEEPTEIELIPKIKRHEYLNSSSGLEEYGFNLFKLYRHFNEKYPGEAIDGDLSAEIEQMFPSYSRQEIYDREENIRFIIKNYRGLKGIYEEIKAGMLVPPPPPLIVEDEDFARSYDEPYIQSDKLVVILDPKKVVNYGSNRRNFEAIEAKIERERKKSSTDEKFDNLKSLLSQLEISKIPFYGSVYEDPFTGKDGIGRAVGDKYKLVRLVSENSKTGDNPNIRAGIELILEPGYTLGWQEKDLEIELDGSRNLSGYQLFRPVPHYYRGSDGQMVMAGYQNKIIFPLSINISDPTKPLQLKAKIKAKICDPKQECKEEVFAPELELLAGERQYSGIYNSIAQNFNAIAKPQSADLRVTSVIVDQPLQQGEAQTLRVNLDADDDPALFEIFVDSAEQIEFETPKISIYDGKITARLTPKDASTELRGKSFIIAARLNNANTIRKEHIAKAASFFDVEPNSLSLGIIFLALMGGLILNFMPCVFPVLSLKLMTLTNFGGRDRAKVRQGFIYTLCGILVAFIFLICGLLILKQLGHSIGWGMQFQNPGFLVMMCFVLVLFMAQISGWLNINTPQWVENILQRHSSRQDALNFLTGMFLVLLATPCSAPYLGTAVGFALTGSNWDIILVIGAAGIGLALPYILLVIRPDLADFMPHPGPWIKHLNRLMQLFLLLTIIWLIFIIGAQSESATAIRIGIYALIFLGILGFRKLLEETTERQNATTEIKLKVIKIFDRATLLLSAILIIVSWVDVYTSFGARKLAQNETQMIDHMEINRYLKEDKIVLLSVGADWCLTCKFNEITVLDNYVIQDYIRRGKMQLIEVDWTNYNREVLDFMEKYGRKGLPFYVIYSQRIPNGMVLPEILTEKELSGMIKKLLY